MSFNAPLVRWMYVRIGDGSEWAASLQPGWQQARMDNFMTLVSGGFADEDLVNDGWTEDHS
ncbi:MAG: hypothetical protein CM15mP120_28860 [Pseudomonadota bacterium]|nr:MAG: hypothetical protein CM15mP120_28860 [Pseudomonadota bacterium]